MSASEFDIIQRYFTVTPSRDDVVLAIGDDAALLAPRSDRQLAITVDTLIAGVHFPETTSAADIACKAIAVNLSDLAAMAAEPAWLTLALTLPTIDEPWLAEFSQAFHNMTQHYGVALIGGDTTRGALGITVQAMGYVRQDKVLRRDAADVGDDVYVTGTLGDAALALRLLQSDLFDGEAKADREFLLSRLNRPTPRVEFALALADYTSCAIDVSDGLLADLGHITTASDCGAEIELSCLPFSSALLNVYANNTDSPDLQSVLTGGDDYELCFTLKPEHAEAVKQIAQTLDLRVTRIGSITASGEIVCRDQQGDMVGFSNRGYQHF